MIGTITIHQAPSGQFWFRVSSKNGATLCHSEQYWNWSDCYHAAQIIQQGGGTIK